MRLYQVKVISVVDCGTHSIFIADVTESKVISDEASLTYAYYYEHIKPKKVPRHLRRALRSARFESARYADMSMKARSFRRILYARYVHPASDFELREI